MGRSRLRPRSDDPATHRVDLVRRLPVLDARAEKALCGRWHDQHDVAAAGQLVRRGLRLVAEHRGRQVAPQGLAAEGSTGLMRSRCSHIRPSDAGFMAYEAHWVRAAIFQSALGAEAPIEASTPPLSMDRRATVLCQALGPRSTGDRTM